MDNLNSKNYTIYHIAHEQFVQKHRFKCKLLPDEEIHLIDGSGYPSFSKLINTCVVNCPTETVIIFSYKVYPFPDQIEKILKYLNEGYAFVGLHRFAFFGFKKELMRKIGFFDERFVLGGCEDEDFLLRMKEVNLGFYMSHESIVSNEYSGWTSQFSEERPTASYKHFVAKWKKFSDGKKIQLKRQISDEIYDYDLGPSTGENFIPWKKSLICTYMHNGGSNDIELLKNPFNIYDKKLLAPPYGNRRTFRRYIELL